MAHDVFISCSSIDKPVADAVCSALEAERIRCWIAPRDIRPGREWGEAIIEGITNARIMILIFSGNANRSPQVVREVSRAVNHRLVIIPFRIEDVVPQGSLEYFLATPHWLDALTPPLERHLEYLVETVRGVLAPAAQADQPADVLPAPGALMGTRVLPSPPAPAVPESSEPPAPGVSIVAGLPEPRRRRRAMTLAVAGAIAVAALVAVVVGLTSHASDKAGPPNTTLTSSAPAGAVSTARTVPATTAPASTAPSTTIGLPSTTDASGFHDSCISAQCRALERALPFPVTDQPFDIFKMAAYCGERDPAWKKAAGAGEEIILQCMRVTGKAAGFPSTGVEVGVLTFSSLADRNKRYSVDKAGAETAIGHGLSDLGALGADCLATGPCERGLRPGDDKTGTGSVFGLYDSKLGYQTLEWFQDAPTGLCDGDPRCSYVLWAIGFSSAQADFAEADHLYTNFCTTDACMAAWS